MRVVLPARRRPKASHLIWRFAPFGSMAGLSALAAIPPNDAIGYVLAGIFGAGAVVSGRRLLDRQRNRRREIRRWARENAKELRGVALEDRAAAWQMKRIAALQRGVLESWELLPAGYDPFLSDEIFTILGEVENTANLARRRAALRRHLRSMDQGVLAGRLRALALELLGEKGSVLRRSFEGAEGRDHGESEGYNVILESVGAINARIESVESLLGSLRGELLTLGTKPISGSEEPELERIREQVARFNRSLDELTRSVDTNAEELTAR